MFFLSKRFHYNWRNGDSRKIILINVLEVGWGEVCASQCGEHTNLKTIEKCFHTFLKPLFERRLG